MKGYGEYFQECIEPDWSSHYIDYSTIKQKLSSFRHRRRRFTQLVNASNLSGYVTLEDYRQLLGVDESNNEDASSYFQYGNYVDAEDALQRIYITERKEFSSLLEYQISNAAIFYEETLLPRVRQLITTCQFQDAAAQLLEVVAFATVNIITFRQLLIRYDVSSMEYEVVTLHYIVPITQFYSYILIIYLVGFLPKLQRNAIVRIAPTAKYPGYNPSRPWLIRAGGCRQARKGNIIGIATR